MSEQEKQNLAESIRRKYGNRKGFKNLFSRANREIFKDDILQPFEANFKKKWYPGWKSREAQHDAVDREMIQKAKALDEVYQKSDKVVSLEQKTLKDIQREHPTMIHEEDIIKWQKN